MVSAVRVEDKNLAVLKRCIAGIDFLQVPHVAVVGIAIDDVFEDEGFAGDALDLFFENAAVDFRARGKIKIQEEKKDGQNSGDEKEWPGYLGEVESIGLHDDEFAVAGHVGHDVDGREKEGNGDDGLGDFGQLYEVKFKNKAFGSVRIDEIGEGVK